MNLKTLLNRITGLPWLLVSATDGDKWIGTGQGDDRIATLDGNTTPLDHAYLVHAANVLPDLVAAVKHLQQNWGKNLTEPMARLNAVLAKAEDVNLGDPTAGHVHQPPRAQLARTTHETIHGNPGERRILPVNTLVAIEPASNLPANSAIKYWAHPVEDHPWPADTAAWAEDVGVGLREEDVALVKMPAYRV